MFWIIALVVWGAAVAVTPWALCGLVVAYGGGEILVRTLRAKSREVLPVGDKEVPLVEQGLPQVAWGFVTGHVYMCGVQTALLGGRRVKVFDGHEMSHVRHLDVPKRQLLQAAIIGMWIPQTLSLVGGEWLTLFALIALSYAMQFLVFVWCRHIEYRADQEGVSAGTDPQEFIKLLNELEPHRSWWVWYLLDHPSPMKRAKALGVEAD